jgi:hypothetical protein
MYRPFQFAVVAALAAANFTGCAYDEHEYAAAGNSTRHDEAGVVALGSSRERYAYAEAATQPPRPDSEQPARGTDAQSTIANWPEVSRKAATTTIQKYGQPQGVTPVMLVWKDNGPWACTIVMRDPIKHDFPMAHEDCLEQFIHYKVPPDKFDELAMYDGSVVCERTAGWLSARCDKEEANFLAINLAHQIVTGKMNVDQARQEYAKSVMAMMNGEKPELMQRLQFEPATGGTGDPDKPAKDMKDMKDHE